MSCIKTLRTRLPQAIQSRMRVVLCLQRAGILARWSTYAAQRGACGIGPPQSSSPVALAVVAAKHLRQCELSPTPPHRTTAAGVGHARPRGPTSAGSAGAAVPQARPCDGHKTVAATSWRWSGLWCWRQHNCNPNDMRLLEC